MQFFKQRMHPQEFNRYKRIQEDERLKLNRDRIEYQESKFDQNVLNRMVLDFMINGMHQPGLLEDPTFAKLLNGKMN